MPPPSSGAIPPSSGTAPLRLPRNAPANPPPPELRSARRSLRAIVAPMRSSSKLTDSGARAVCACAPPCGRPRKSNRPEAIPSAGAKPSPRSVSVPVTSSQSSMVKPSMRNSSRRPSGLRSPEPCADRPAPDRRNARRLGSGPRIRVTSKSPAASAGFVHPNAVSDSATPSSGDVSRNSGAAPRPARSSRKSSVASPCTMPSGKMTPKASRISGLKRACPST